MLNTVECAILIVTQMNGSFSKVKLLIMSEKLFTDQINLVLVYFFKRKSLLVAFVFRE